MDPLADLMRSTAAQLGISPLDLATAISYETGGTFDPWQAGPTTKWGQHRGLIQMGEPQRAQYGYEQNEPLAGQFDAIAKYLIDTGVQPGMGLLDVYSAINAGGVGRYGASDTAAGGAPGNVRDKVEQQMGGHRVKAEQLLGESAQPSAPPMSPQMQAPAPPPQQPSSPLASLMQAPMDFGAGVAAQPPPTPQPESAGNAPMMPQFDFQPKRKVSDYRAPDLGMISTSVRPLSMR